MSKPTYEELAAVVEHLGDMLRRIEANPNPTDVDDYLDEHATSALAIANRLAVATGHDTTLPEPSTFQNFQARLRESWRS